MKTIILTEEQIKAYTEATDVMHSQILNENRSVTFGGKAYPIGGWAVIVIGGVASGKSTIEKSKLLINGKVINSDHWREMVADAINNETENPNSAMTSIKSTSQYNTSKLGGRVDLKKTSDINAINDLATGKRGLNFLSKQKNGILNGNIGKPSGILPNLLFEIGGNYMERIPEIIEYLDAFKKTGLKKVKKNKKALSSNKEKFQKVFKLRFKDGNVEKIYFNNEDELFRGLKERLGGKFSDDTIRRLMANVKNIENVNESVDNVDNIDGYKISVVWVISNRQVAFASMLNRDRHAGPISFHKSHNYNSDNEEGVLAAINSVNNRIDEAWCIVNSSFDTNNGLRTDRRLNKNELENNVIKIPRDKDGEFVLPEEIKLGSSLKKIVDIIGEPKTVRTYNGFKKEGMAKSMPDQNKDELSYSQYPTVKNANDWADTHNGQFLKNVDVYRKDNNGSVRDHSTLFEYVKRYVKNVLTESVDEYGFSIVKYGNSGRGKPKYFTVYDNSDENGNFIYDLTQLNGPERKKAFQLIQNGEKLPRDIPGINPQPNGIDLDTRTKIDRSHENTDGNPYISSSKNAYNDVLMFIKDNYEIIKKLLSSNKTIYPNIAKQIQSLLNKHKRIGVDFNSGEVEYLVNYCNKCLSLIAKTIHVKGFPAVRAQYFKRNQKINEYNTPEISPKENSEDKEAQSSDFIVIVAGLLTGMLRPENIDYYATKYSKTSNYYNNRQKLLNSGSEVSYYKSVVPSTSVEVITLFPFKDFGGTELLKANALSVKNDIIKQKYDTTITGNESGKDRIASEFVGNSKENFLDMTVQHAWKVLSENEHWIPNYVICVPSSARFNEDYIKRLAKGNPSCKSYEAFIIKDWINYQVDNRTRERIEEYLGYLAYRGNNRLGKSVDNVMELIKRGVSNTALWMVSKILDDILFKKFKDTEKYRNDFVKYYIQQFQRTGYDSRVIFNAPQNRLKNDVTKLFPSITGNRDITIKIFDAIDNAFLKYIKGDAPLKINISQCVYKEKEQQMTSLVRSGATGAAISGQEIRPLIADVYIVNEPKYELTIEGKQMISELQSNQLHGTLNEKEKVELAHQNILIFDDDIDTGSSLKLTINAMNQALEEAKINNTNLKCLTLFGKTSDGGAK